MKFQFIGNAAGTFIGSKGTKILCDPWIVDGIFEGSWFHYPALKTKVNDLQNVDGIYVSHIHPDHYDERYFDFPKEIPIIILNEGPNFLKKNLIKKGYNNFIEIKDGETKKFKEFNLTVYKPFTGNIFEESLLGNLIDSALVLNDGDLTVINFNDNTPNEKACVALQNKFKKIDFALLNYNAAGPYPACFDNLSIEEKKKENDRILKRNFDHLCKIIPLLKPKTVLPFAGSYIIGGKNYFKNDYLGTTTWDECADYLKQKLNSKTKIICLRENQTYDILNQLNIEKYERINLNDKEKYIKSIKDHKYDYEHDVIPNIEKLTNDIGIAKDKLLERSKKFGIDFKSNVFIEIEGKKISILDGKEKNRELICSMDSRLLRRILDKKSHWNNAEIGTHITFKRSPNKMDPDVHTIMSFFHL
tara:strand:- start:1523 stop:2773 length:1251 start_codon:yes stop_codon:yes gene_type:complete